MKTLVTFNDDDASTTFEASYLPSEHWNGAEMPFFTKSEASRIAEDCELHPSSTFYKWEDGTFWEDIAFDETYDVHNWVKVPTMTDTDTGETLYRMGDGWTWSQITDYDYDNDTNDYAELVAAVAELQATFSKIPETELHYPIS